MQLSMALPAVDKASPSKCGQIQAAVRLAKGHNGKTKQLK